MKKKRILLVDDEKDILTTVSMILSNEYDLKIASSGKMALKLLQKESFDLVVLDVFMPNMTGIEVCEEIRKNSKLKNQKVIFLTVATRKDNLKNLNPVDYIQKPFDMDDFQKRVKKILK
jgi:CheY-like chemotaxis protein